MNQPTICSPKPIQLEIKFGAAPFFQGKKCLGCGAELEFDELTFDVCSECFDKLPASDE